jgi:hypothetical protein
MHLWSKKMREEKDKNLFGSGSSADIDPERNLRELKKDIQMLRESVHAAAEKPEFFWKRQHNAIMASLNKPVPSAKYRPALLWVPAALVFILCLFFFVENSKAPTPDLAAGSDQELLIEIERALSRHYPEALAPVAVIDSAIDGMPDKSVSGSPSK